jgi:hypothetical protein
MLPETPVAIKSKRSDKPKVYQRFYDALRALRPEDIL